MRGIQPLLFGLLVAGWIRKPFAESGDGAAPVTGSQSSNGEKFFHSDQHKLFTDLFRDYVKDIRPVHSHAEKINIKFEIALFNVLSLESKTGIMTTNAEVIIRWNDPFLKWDPVLYNDTYELRVNHYNIWEPDIILYNSAADDYYGSIISTNAILTYTGEVKLLLQAIFVSTCDVDIQWYPFDQQTCDLNFGSRTFDLHLVTLETGKSDITRYHPNHEFVLENFYPELSQIIDPCCDYPFGLVSYHIQLQRRVKFAMFFFIVPGILINICAVLVFSLPVEAGEKVGLGINAMLAMMVFLMAMIENLPPSEKIPLAGLYYGVCLAVITANIAFSVYVMNLSYGGNRGHRLPKYLKMITKSLGLILRVPVPPIVENLWQLEEEERENPQDFVHPLDLKATEKPWLTQVHPASQDRGRVSQESKTTEPVRNFEEIKDPTQRRTVMVLEDIHQLLCSKFIKSSAKTEEKRAHIEEWKMASRVLDKLLFICFGLTTFLFNVILLNQSPFTTLLEYCDDPEHCSEAGSQYLQEPSGDGEGH